MIHNGSKTKNSLRNIKYSSFSFFIVSILSFISRSVFIKVLNEQYLGLNGFFSNLLGILSLSELGVSTAMNYVLYKPIQENDTFLIKSIMNLYAKIYRYVGLFIIFIGLIMAPLLPYLIHQVPENLNNICFYFILYVLNSGVSYFFSYKRSLIICDQKEYIIHSISIIFKVFFSIIQIILLLIMKNYTIYLLSSIIFTILENIYISNKVNQLYPFLSEPKVQELSTGQRQIIKGNIRAMIRHKMATVIIHYTDNIIITKFVGLLSVGLYSNYTLIISTLNVMINRIFAPLASSTGFLSLSDDKDHIEEVLYTMLFINFCIYFFCSILFLCLVQPFIELWIGKEYLLSLFTVIVIALNFYIFGMRRTVLLFWESAGIFRYDIYKPIIESIVNLATSLILVKFFGIAGVLMGTICSTVFVCFWWDAYLLFKHLLNKGIEQYLYVQIKYLLITLFTGGFTYCLCSTLDVSIMLFILRMVICLLGGSVVVLVTFWRSREFKSSLNIVLHKGVVMNE